MANAYDCPSFLSGPWIRRENLQPSGSLRWEFRSQHSQNSQGRAPKRSDLDRASSEHPERTAFHLKLSTDEHIRGRKYSSLGNNLWPAWMDPMRAGGAIPRTHFPEITILIPGAQNSSHSQNIHNVWATRLSTQDTASNQISGNNPKGCPIPA